MKDEIRLDLPSASDTAFWNCPGQWQLKQSIPQEERNAIDLPDETTSSGIRVDKARETSNLLDLSAEEVELYENGVKFEALLFDRWTRDFAIEAKPGPCKERLWLHDERTMAPLVSGESDVHYLSLNRPLISLS